uniref:uncharacterized protein LOC122607256 n=1 Tax=Erigeron canadensis TaxID=72917 RepID=UPI001CB89259|nr:uncharacterized protein LOC122607256 [Erigeron canadensis]
MGGDGKANWIKGIKNNEKVNFLAFQETQCYGISEVIIRKYWDFSDMGWDIVEPLGRSGGLVSVWDSDVFKKTSCVKERNFLLTIGKVKGLRETVNIMNVYAPQRVDDKMRLWDRILDLKNNYSGLWFIIGDFNAVRVPEDRKGSSYNHRCSRLFNNFIFEADLEEYSMKGNRFTFLVEDGERKKFSKIDRFLVGSEVIAKWPEACLRVLPRYLSDHSPLLWTVRDTNYGPKPFRFLSSWLDREEFKEIVHKVVDSLSYFGYADVKLMMLFKHLRLEIVKWRNDMNDKEGEEKKRCRLELEELDALMEERNLEEEEEWIRTECKRKLIEFDLYKAKDLKQRSRIVKMKKRLDLMASISSTIHMGCSSSFIALIPKKKDPISLDDYRPIALVGIINKVISKVLACRLKKVLGTVISLNQTAFLGGRCIMDGPLILNELIATVKKRKDKAFLFKIDFAKAYDNVNWGFLMSILEKMGFPSLWCKWIFGILSSARSSVLVNGSPTYEFQCYKGMRQGDPISPFLFLVVMEALTVLINRATKRGMFHGIWLANGLSISHLLYADDCVILGDWDITNLKNIIRILRIFHLCSGLHIHMGKSSLFGIGTTGDELNEMAAVARCDTGTFPVKHLGIWIGTNMNKASSWSFLFDIFEQRLSKWRANSLSIGGRVTLIKSVLESLPTYYLSLYRAPKKVLDGLEKIMRRFLWGGSEARFKNEKDSLWKEVITVIHENKNNWSALPVNKYLSSNWKIIVKAIESIKVADTSLNKIFRGICGNGKEIKFWLDLWTGDEVFRDRFPVLFRLEKYKNCRVSDRYDENSKEFSSLWRWKKLLQSTEEMTEWQELGTLLNGLKLTESIDRWIWQGKNDSQFTVKAVKDFILSSRDYSNRYVLRWSKWIPLKVNIFMWRVGMNRIPTLEALKDRNCVFGDGLCVLCGEYEESVDHLFCGCELANLIWTFISSWCKASPFFVFSIKDLIEIHENVGLGKKEQKVVKGIVMVACWCIWKARNERRFSNAQIKVEKVIQGWFELYV